MKRLFFFLLCGIIPAQGQNPVCPGVPISYTCTTASPGTQHIWRGTAFSGQCSGIPPNQIPISSLQTQTDEVGEKIHCGVFTATVTSITNGISSELTFTASLDLNGLTVECVGGDTGIFTVSLVDSPIFPDEVMQDRSQDSEYRTTLINWQPAVNGMITYTVSMMTDDDVTVIIPDNTQTTALVTLPQFNTHYNVCIEASNECDSLPSTPSCSDPPVIIEAEVITVSSFHVRLLCSQAPITAARVIWTVDRSRVGNKVRPPATMVILMCERERAQNLLPSATEFIFNYTHHPMCFSSSQANFGIEFVNAAGSAMEMETVPLHQIDIQSNVFIIGEDRTVFFQLNPYCYENPELFSVTILYRPIFDITSSVSDSEVLITEGVLVTRNGEYGFEAVFKQVYTVYKCEIIIHLNGVEIERISNVTAVLTGDSITRLHVVVPILSAVTGLLTAILISTCVVLYYTCKKVTSQKSANNVEMKATVVPEYEDVNITSQRPRLTRIHIEKNEAYVGAMS